MYFLHLWDWPYLVLLKFGDHYYKFYFNRKTRALENYPREQRMEAGRIKQYWIITDTN